MAHSLLYLPEGRAMLQHSWQGCRVDEQNQALPLLCTRGQVHLILSLFFQNQNQINQAPWYIKSKE
jgi:hypothetical protein